MAIIVSHICCWWSGTLKVTRALIRYKDVHGNIKMPYRNIYCGDKTNLTLFYLQNGISFTSKTNVDLQKIVPLETNVIHDSNPKHQRFYGRNTFQNSIYETTAIVW